MRGARRPAPGALGTLAVSRSARLRERRRAVHVLHAQLPRRPPVVHGHAASRSHRHGLSEDDAGRAVHQPGAALGADHRARRRHDPAHAAPIAARDAHRRGRDRPGCGARGRPLLRIRCQRQDARDRDGRTRLRQARAARHAALRPDHARCIRPRIHSRASADAGISGGSEVAAGAGRRARSQHVLVERTVRARIRDVREGVREFLQPEARESRDPHAAERACRTRSNCARRRSSSPVHSTAMDSRLQSCCRSSRRSGTGIRARGS